MGCTTSRETCSTDCNSVKQRQRARRDLHEHPPPLKLELEAAAHVEKKSTAHTSCTPVVTPQAEDGSITGPRRRPKSVERERVDDDRRSFFSREGIASSNEGGEDGLGRSEGKPDEGDETGNAQRATAKQSGDGLARAQEHHDQKLPPQGQPGEEAEGGGWPALPPVFLVLHLFLENSRPPNTGSSDFRRVRFPGGLAYEGQLRDDDEGWVPHGWGRITCPDGAFYEGSWHRGLVHGAGALHLPTGNCYFGSWIHGRKHGLGTYLYADGSCHEGFYACGERNGSGRMQYASGAVFEGEFQDGRRHGVGRLELASGGECYDGDWVDDIPHGHGLFVDPAGGGERFEGSWRHGIRKGGGVLTQGWAKHESVGEGREDDEDRQCPHVAWYSGRFEEGYPHGYGLMKYGSATFHGCIEQGVWNGGGRIDLGEEGVGIFEGAWLDGIPRGCGRWTCKQSGVEADSTFEEGYVQQDRPN